MLQYVTCTYFFSLQFRPTGRPVMFILAIFSLIFSVSPRISDFSYFLVLIFEFHTHGRMHVISVTYKYPPSLFAPGMQIFIRCLPRRSSSGTPLAWPRTNQKFDWDTSCVTKTRNKNIGKARKLPINRKNKRKFHNESNRLTRFQLTVRTENNCFFLNPANMG